jgi:hypothetical protein
MPLVAKTALSHFTTRVDTPPAPQHYGSIIGFLLWLACATRPDLAHVASALALFMAAPTPEHLDCAHRACRYLRGTENLELILGGSHMKTSKAELAHSRTSQRWSLPPVLTAHSDSDFAGCPDTRRSVGGMIRFFYFFCCALVLNEIAHYC